MELTSQARTPRSFDQTSTYRSNSITEDLNWLLKKVAEASIEQVLAVDLSRPEFELPVVRVVIPGLEGPAGHEQGDFVPGPRARKFAQASV